MTAPEGNGAAGPGPHADQPLLRVSGLSIDFATASGYLNVVEDVSFEVADRETLALVGESGSGKTVSALSIMGLLPRRSSRVRANEMRFDGRDLLSMGTEETRRMRGDEISMIFQEPMTSLNPAFSVGNQIVEAVRVHRSVSKAQARQRALEVLDLVGIADPRRRLDDYPHALSGGMRQRVMIAMALACEPKLLIADEPTTALDVTIQAQVLDLLGRLQAELGMAILFVTHDLGVVAEIADRITVLYAGQTAEVATVDELFSKPRHPYSEALMASMPQVAAVGQPLTVIPGQVPRPGEFPGGCRFHPRCSYAVEACTAAAPALVDGSRCIRREIELSGTAWKQSPVVAASNGPASNGPARTEPAGQLLDVRDLVVHFRVQSKVLRRVVGHVKAVDGVSFSIAKGQTLGLVGESGSGKSTTARLVLRLIEPNAGTVSLDGIDVTKLDKTELRHARRKMQIVFQDPYSSLDPRSTIGESVGEPLEVHEGLHGRARDERVGDLLGEVGLDRRYVSRYPHEFSGGQRQRIAVARALALRPELLICDEPVSSLDVSTQSQVINLLDELQDRLGLTCLFIAHDLSVVRHISDRIAVMYLGRIVEIGDAEQVYTRPTHPYTEALLSAIPVPDPAEQRRRARIVLNGDIPSPFNPPSGCRFHTRCPYAMEVCSEEDPLAVHHRRRDDGVVSSAYRRTRTCGCTGEHLINTDHGIGASEAEIPEDRSPRISHTYPTHPYRTEQTSQNREEGKMKSKLQVAGAVLGMVVVLAACSTNSSSSSTTTTSTTAAASTSTTAASTTTTKPAQSITITPNTGLANNQVVSITGTGYPAKEELGITECANKGAQTGAGDCNLGGIKVVYATAAGTVSAHFAVALGPFGANHIVCTSAPDCLVSVAQAGVADPNSVATEVIHFS